MNDGEQEFHSLQYNTTLDQSPLSLGLRASSSAELFITPPKMRNGEEEIGIKRLFDSTRKVLTYDENSRLCIISISKIRLRIV